MEIKEAAERVVIAKPVASKPSCSTFRSFSELLAGAINDSSPPRASCSETVVAAIRPKTVRVAKPAASSASAAGLLAASCSQSQAGVSRAAAPGQLLDSLLAPDTRSTVVYKPLAKVVSKSTVSLLANMGNFNTSLQQKVPIIEEPQLQELSRPQGLYLRSRQLPEKGAPSVAEPSSRLAEVSRGQPSWQNTEEDQKSLPAVANVDRPSYDGYNWRKYGQKQVKGSEYPRSYYKCTHPNCPVKKKVERSFDGHITEIVYKGEHNHAKPQPPKKNNAPAATAQGNNDQSEGNDQQDFNNVNINTSNNKSSLFLNDASHQNRNAMMRLLSANSAYQASHPILSFDNVVNASLNESTPDNSCGVSGDGSKGIDAGDHHEEPKSKRRKADQVRLSDQAGPSGDGVQQAPKIVVQSSTDTEIVGDGYRWRKYGQKVVKGNPYPRSYYRCTSLECNVRKHVERASEDPNSFITTYEGKHSHEMPAKNANQAASEQGSQSQTNRDRK